MTTPDPHHLYDELVAGQALRALEPEDEQRLAAHLPSCGRCLDALGRHAETLAHLAYAADPAEPPPALLEGIRREVAATPRRPVVVPAVPAQADPTDDPADRPVREGAAAVLPFRPRAARSAGRGRGLVGVAAGLALLLGLGAWNLTLQREADEQGQLSTRLAAAVATLEDGPGVTVPLTATDSDDVPLVAVLHDDELSVVVDGLAPNDVATSTYVVWFAGPEGVTSLGTFDVRDDGVSVTTGLTAPSQLTDASQLMVTREPGRTAPATTREPVLAAGRLA